jgi:hypothetical protein
MLALLRMSERKFDLLSRSLMSRPTTTPPLRRLAARRNQERSHPRESAPEIDRIDDRTIEIGETDLVGLSRLLALFGSEDNHNDDYDGHRDHHRDDARRDNTRGQPATSRRLRAPALLKDLVMPPISADLDYQVSVGVQQDSPGGCPRNCTGLSVGGAVTSSSTALALLNGISSPVTASK